MADDPADNEQDWKQSQEEAKARLEHAEALFTQALHECMTVCKGDPVSAFETLLRRAFTERELASAIIYSHVSLTLEGLARNGVAGPAPRH